MQPRAPKDLWGAAWPAEWDPNLGPDLPADGHPFELEHWKYRWPTHVTRGIRRLCEYLSMHAGQNGEIHAATTPQGRGVLEICLARLARCTAHRA